MSNKTLTVESELKFSNPALSQNITTFGDHALRLSIALILLWIGAMKFSAYEAGAIEGLISSSPLTSWLYNVFSLQGASNFIGAFEIATAIAIILSPINRLIGIIGLSLIHI